MQASQLSNERLVVEDKRVPVLALLLSWLGIRLLPGSRRAEVSCGVSFDLCDFSLKSGHAVLELRVLGAQTHDDALENGVTVVAGDFWPSHETFAHRALQANRSAFIEPVTPQLLHRLKLSLRV